MEIDPDRIEIFRPDANRFILGVLWLTVVGIFSYNTEGIVGALTYIDTILGSLTHIVVPSYIIVFIFLLMGILLPYCLSEVFNSMGILIMNLTIPIYHHFTKRDDSLRNRAGNVIMVELVLDFVPPTSTWSAFLKVYSPKIAHQFRSRLESIYFKASSLIPATIILGWLIYNALFVILSKGYSITLSIILSLSIFIVAVFSNNDTLHSHYDRLSVAILMSHKQHLNSILGSGPSTNS